jgi:hypothetical protein
VLGERQQALTRGLGAGSGVRKCGGARERARRGGGGGTGDAGRLDWSADTESRRGYGSGASEHAQVERRPSRQAVRTCKPMRRWLRWQQRASVGAGRCAAEAA